MKIRFVPESITADNAPAISSAIENNFPGLTRINCHFHTFVSIKKFCDQYKSKPSELLNDFYLFQECTFTKMFKKAQDLFIKKWEDEREINVDLEAVKKKYFNHNYNWYEGANIFSSSTNNTNESFNFKIKVDY
ncbi:hypothetical protein BB558_006498 [Smittium angustum]|uniref:MULE transposase domain-containing protein n=1 Tax=Smittium angustum TaxID=133377 RepID=A0A2U1IXL3_SMIAN|nr:hypothetical protein BB558_006498 [Smittium angustum]